MVNKWYKPERAKSFIVVDVGGRYGGDHGRLGVTSEVLTKQPS